MLSIVQNISKKTGLGTQEAWWLLEKITHKPKEKLLLESALTPAQEKLLHDLLDQLINKNIPLAYLLGETQFLNLKLTVQPPILIPRPETEEWADQLIKKLEPHKDSITSILDIGTGSGCIALSLAQTFPQAQITATDINPQALALAQKNAGKNNISNIQFIQSDLFTNISGSFDLIVSNPPYIDPAEKKDLSLQVAQWEDHQALFAENAGLSIIESLLSQSRKFLKKNNLPFQLVIETDRNQRTELVKLAQQWNWSISIQQDFSGKDRTIWLTAKK